MTLHSPAPAIRTGSAAQRDNNFNLIRILAAVAVLCSHAYPIGYGQGVSEPFETTLGLSLGTLSVLTFFAISGFFITQSFGKKRTLLDFVIARSLRIYPALLVVLFLSVFVLGPLSTNLTISEYFLNPSSLLYIPRNLRLWPLQYNLPGVFANNPTPEVVNGSLWSLGYEVGCYAMVAVIGLFGAINRRYFPFFLFIYSAGYIGLYILPSNIHHYAMLRVIGLLSFPFVLGMSFFCFREQIIIRLDVCLLLVVASILSHGHVWFRELFIVTWTYGVFYFGYFKWAPLHAYNAVGDYSYGVYIYAYPIEQMVTAIFRGISPIIIITLSIPLTLALAVLSWHLIEARALSWRSTVGSWLTSTFWPGLQIKNSAALSD